MDGQTAVTLCQLNAYDVIIMDVMLPRMDGLSCLTKLRQQGNDTPVLMLTARDTLEDKLAGFEAGADDYLVKPFALPELLVRLLALQRRRSAEPAISSHYQIGDLRIDKALHQVTYQGKMILVNKTGFKILLLLAQQSPKPVSRQRIAREVWDSEQPDSDALRTHLYHLRQAIERVSQIPLLETVRGVGVRLIKHQPDEDSQRESRSFTP